MNDAVAAAIKRGEKAASKKSKWRPVGVENRGWLVARIEDTTNGNVEGVYNQLAQWLFYGVGMAADGKYIAHVCRNPELKRIAKAMLEPGDPEEKDTLLRTAPRRVHKENPEAEPRRVRRKTRR